MVFMSVGGPSDVITELRLSGVLTALLHVLAADLTVFVCDGDSRNTIANGGLEMYAISESGAPILHIRFGRLGDSISMVLHGDLDEYSVMALHAAVQSIPPYEHVYLDCAAVEFIDSHGLAALRAEHDWLERQHGSLRLINLSDATLRILRLCRVTPELTAQPNIAV